MFKSSFEKTQVVLHMCLVSMGILYHHHGNKVSPIITKTHRVARSSLCQLTKTGKILIIFFIHNTALVVSKNISEIQTYFIAADNFVT